jgi:sugar lactone lactonase YvrE
MAGTAGKLGYTDATGASAQFSSPGGVITDGTNLYVADAGNNVIRKIVISTGVVSTLAGTGTAGYVDSTNGLLARFSGPLGITTDGTNLYVADTGNNCIRQIVISNGAVSTFVTSTLGAFLNPAAITYDGKSNLYVADTGHSIIKVVPLATGTPSVLTVAGLNLNSPHGITTDGTNLYVADTSNNAIEQIVISSLTFTTLATTGLSVPQGITTDGTNLYVANSGDHTIRKTPILSPTLTIVAGTSTVPGSTDGTGSAALFRYPGGITTDGTNLYITDTGNQTIRKIQ